MAQRRFEGRVAPPRNRHHAEGCRTGLIAPSTDSVTFTRRAPARSARCASTDCAAAGRIGQCHDFDGHLRGQRFFEQMRTVEEDVVRRGFNQRAETPDHRIHDSRSAPCVILILATARAEAWREVLPFVCDESAPQEIRRRNHAARQRAENRTAAGNQARASSAISGRTPSPC